MGVTLVLMSNGWPKMKIWSVWREEGNTHISVVFYIGKSPDMLWMFLVSGRTGSRIRRPTSPASTKGRWTMTFTFSQHRLSTVSLCFVHDYVSIPEEACPFVGPLDLVWITFSGPWYHSFYPSPVPAVSFQQSSLSLPVQRTSCYLRWSL